jgi:hypothetical protein
VLWFCVVWFCGCCGFVGGCFLCLCVVVCVRCGFCWFGECVDVVIVG